ncbi:putative DNA-dependent RNA polymerase [Erwinia phage Micant]|uniref:DNA-directed RNA polymerase n=1 Tax=Erwinia phage Micant TaxID=2923255 RepID=A0AAE9JVD3_9CAUD|nr:putative DNA-dependent RNA polymerase [Erwinia phage Micant]
MQTAKISGNITEALVQRQLDIENKARTRAIDRSRKAVKDALDGGRASELLPVQRLISAAFSTVSDSIDGIKADKTRGVGGKYRKHLRLINTDVLATATMVYVLDSICAEALARSSAQALMAGLGRMVQSEILNRNLEVAAPAYINRVHEYMKEKNTRSQSHILRTMRASADAVKLAHEPWSNSECIAVGKLLMGAVYDTGLFKWVSSSNQMNYLTPSDTLEKVLTDVITHSHMLMIAPPMIIPPQDHTTMFDGGYLTDIDRRGTYKNRHITNKQRREVAEDFAKADKLKAALNKAQNVGYMVNGPVLEFVQAARAQGIGIGMPSTRQAPKPEWRLDGVPREQYDARELDDFNEWKMMMREWYGTERKRVSRLRGTATTLEICEEYKDEPAMYFPTCVDWRYRLYFKSALNPQGSDLQKALLTFSKGKPLGNRGLFWLKVNVATTFGYDKALFEERAAWVDLHFASVEQCADSPFDSDSFKNADSPWCFLAACIELVNAVRSGNPEEYVSHLPVAMDATNSGGQHFSAMLRDEVGGRLTNLFWNGNNVKADLYMDVKQRTDSKVIIAQRDEDTVVQATYWRENEITRSMTKRPSMTFFYSATVRSCSEYILLGARDEGYDGLEDFSMMKLSGFLAPLMRQSIEDAMPAAAKAMKCAQEICRTIPLENHLQWNTPLGGLVINRYTTTEETRVAIRSMGLSLVVAYNRDYTLNNRRKAASGIAPNFVHSLDSTHLMMVILGFYGDIVPIHDSLATHAADCDEMHRVIRQEFFNLYNENAPLEVLREAAEKAGGDTSEIVMPEMGTLDLELVKDSPFFFC